MTNRTIASVAALFVVLFSLLAARAAYVMVIDGPSIAAKPFNPRHALVQRRRGRILATDGTVLAESVGGRRVYPLGDSLAQTLGYISTRYGASGIEAAYDRALTPSDTTGDIAGQWAELLAAFRGTSAKSHGADVVTTIVPAIQKEAWTQLDAYARGAVVVLDPRSGAVLALASVPSFDPNTIDRTFAHVASNAQSPLLNRSIEGLYPPGSTFKVFTAGAALESGTVSMSTTFQDPGYLHIGTFTLHDNDNEATGYQDLTGAFALSSNVDFGGITLKMGLDRFYRYLRRWGIGASLDFQLPAATARFPPKNDVTPGELAQMGFGQGALLVTPLQMALIASTVANGGVEPRPFIVRQIVRAGVAASVTPAGALSTPISADTAADVKKMMVAVVQRGTGTTAQLAGVQVAGKTGTATNPHGAAHSWFVCFAPANRPRVAVAVVVENAGYGATVAAPIARNVLRVALRTITR